MSLLLATGGGGATNTPVNPGAGTITVTGYAPSILQPIAVSPAQGAVTLTGYAPSIVQNNILTPTQGAIAITGYAPSISQILNYSLNPAQGAVTLTGYAPTVAQSVNNTVAPAQGALTLTGYAPSIVQNQFVSPTFGALAITGYAPTITQNFTLVITQQQAVNLEAIIRLHGLISPLVVNNTSRGDGTVTQTLSGTTTVTVTTTANGSTGAPTAAHIDLLSRHYGLISPMVEQATTRSDGTLTQTVVTVGSDTTITKTAP